jgi:cation diffusion facilitator family transporter
MHTQSVDKWQHDHTFEQDKIKSGERKTFIVIGITAATMVVEIVAGIIYGSMALLADGLHMGSHATALGVAAVAYVFARRRAKDSSFSFGTGKVNSLAGFSSAVLLAVFALMMGIESADRFFNPVTISFNQAIIVSVIGLVVNLACMFILDTRKQHHSHDHHQDHAHHETDHNLKAAYLHVLADALTSLLAIFALLGGKFLGFIWMDPLMGVVGAIMVARWSLGLLRETSGVLLDRQGSPEVCQKIQAAIEAVGDNRVSDLHLWHIGPGIFAATISIVTQDPRSPDHYKAMIPENLGIVHSTIEIHPCSQ